MILLLFVVVLKSFEVLISSHMTNKNKKEKINKTKKRQ